jgi:putative endonuclease
MMAENHDLGRYGEELTCRYLTYYGFVILARNYRIRGGEIDIIANFNDLIVFVEVKTRHVTTESNYGSALEAVNFRKREHIIKTAKKWIYANFKYSKCNFRFDVSEIQVDKRNKYKINYLKSAFLLS